MPRHARPRRFFCAAATLATLALCNACTQEPTNAPVPAEPSATVELRSWRVAGQGRHLYLQIDAPTPFEHLRGRVEFTKISLRRDYTAPRSQRRRGVGATLLGPRFDAANLGRMSRGDHLLPVMPGDPADRLESDYTVTIDTARLLQQDLVFTAAYRLLGPNSNTGLRAAMERAGLELPARITDAGGPLGTFPGINADPGRPLDPALWSAVGLPRGPSTVNELAPAPEPGATRTGN